MLLVSLLFADGDATRADCSGGQLGSALAKALPAL